jgi:hypothetical protein
VATPAPSTPEPAAAPAPEADKPAPAPDAGKTDTPPEPVKPVPEKQAPKETVPQVAAAPRRPPALPSEATFHLTTAPAGAEAVFDSSQKCTTPCTVTLPNGRHTFVAHKVGFREAHRIFEIPQDSGLIVDLIRATGMLSLTSQPSGCSIVVDGQEQAQKTPASLMLGVGQHRIQVLQGTRREEFMIDIRDGAIVNRAVELTPQ